MPRPDLTRVPDYFHNYINQAEGDELEEVLKKQTRSFEKFLEDIPKSKRNYRYAEGKWTIREVLQHIIDAERIFAYRALCFARKDTTPLTKSSWNQLAQPVANPIMYWVSALLFPVMPIIISGSSRKNIWPAQAP